MLTFKESKSSRSTIFFRDEAYKHLEKHTPKEDTKSELILYSPVVVIQQKSLAYLATLSNQPQMTILMINLEILAK